MSADAVAVNTYVDRVVPFLIDGRNVAGRFVRLDSVTSEILRRHDYPPVVAQLLGEALALVALMGSALKFDGRFVMQTKTQGPVSMLVADYTSTGALRGYAQFDVDAVSQLDNQSDLQDLTGDGYVAFSVDQGPDMERYQGIVPMEGRDLREVALAYFERSEQIPTHLKLSAGSLHRPGQPTDWRAGGLMVQQIADEGGAEMGTLDADDWTRIGLLLSTASDEEMLDVTLDEGSLAYRLFHEDGVRLLGEKAVTFGCSCSHDRVMNMLAALPEQDRLEINQDKDVTITCEFCSTEYTISTPI